MCDEFMGKIIDRLGMPAGLLSVVTSFQQEIEWYLRLVILTSGAILALARLYRYFCVKDQTKNDQTSD